MTHLPLDLVDFDRQLADTDSPLPLFRDAFRQGAEHLAESFASGGRVTHLVEARSRLTDELLARTWRLAMPFNADAALVAVGGYGRGELHPHSDVDIMVLLGTAEPDITCRHVEKLLTFFWDMGLEVGHSVRTVDDCVREARDDITVATNIMESRLLAGDEKLFDAMRKATGPDRIWPSDRFFAAKQEEQEKRYEKYDDTAYNLEPNIKESPGGLRDIQIIGWVAKRHFGAQTMHDLVDHGFLTETEYRSLMEGQEYLWRIRFALHTLTGRREDRLLFDYQRTLANQFGYDDSTGNLAVEHFMQRYYRTVMELSRLNEMLLQYFQEAILLKGDQPPVPINRRFQSRDGFLETLDGGVFQRYPLALLEVFLLLQQETEVRGVRASTIRQMFDNRDLIDDEFRADLGARSLFMEILRQPTGITHALRRMNRYGILGAYIPAFENIVGRMQYDLFHVYTVDEHSMFVIRNLRRLLVPRYQGEFPLCTDLMYNLPKPELIYLAALFHDIAKGRGGDHSELGARDAWDFCKHHGLSNYDAGLVAWLVRKHLIMSMTAQRKDIEDPEVIQEFAAEVADLNRLNYLYLLTLSDSRATNPKRWNSWKNTLLQQLYSSTRSALSRGLDNPQAQDELIQQKQEEVQRDLVEEGFSPTAINALWMNLSIDYFLHSSPDEIAWQTRIVLKSSPDTRPLVLLRRLTARGSTEVFICTADRDNLFALTASMLDQLGLNVLDARIQNADSSCTMNSFMVLEEDGSPVAAGHREQEILEALNHALTHPDGASLDVNRRLPRQMKHFDIPTQVWFEQDEANQRTTLRLQAMDRPGLLAKIGHVFSQLDVRINTAKIATVGAQAEDNFFITDRNDRPITDPAQLDDIKHELLEELSS